MYTACVCSEQRLSRETIALADGAAGMAQVVLQKVAVGVVVHEVLVDVGDMIRPQQVAHLFVAARAGMAVGKAVAERQPFVRRGRKEGVETEVADTFGAVFERIMFFPLEILFLSCSYCVTLQ